MRVSRVHAGVVAALLAGPCSSAFAQTQAQVSTTTTDLTLANTISNLVRPVGAAHVGEALAFATQLEVGTAPFGAASGGFLIRLDPSTGLQVRASTTFGPAFAPSAFLVSSTSVDASTTSL